MTTLSHKPVLAFALAAALVVAGCGKSRTDDQPVSNETAASNAASALQLSAPPPDLVPATATAGPLSGAGDFASKSLSGPFAEAEQSLKESYNRALVAFQIGDFARASSELRDLAKNPDLTPDQKQAVENLLAQSLRAAPESAVATSPATATPSSKTNSPLQPPTR
jgi:hypothetical protein